MLVPGEELASVGGGEVEFAVMSVGAGVVTFAPKGGIVIFNMETTDGEGVVSVAFPLTGSDGVGM
jgi:hypothetical protein